MSHTGRQPFTQWNAYQVYTTPSDGLNVEARRQQSQPDALPIIEAWADCDLNGTPMAFDDTIARSFAKAFARQAQADGFHL